MTRGPGRTPATRAASGLAMVAMLLIVSVALAGAALTASSDAAPADAARAHPGVAPVNAAGARPAVNGRWWVPSLGSQPWQWELSNPLDLSKPKAMGTADRLPNGSVAPAPTIYDIDGIINPASTVTALHASGKHVVCYIEVGAVGNYYTAAEEGVPNSYFDQLRAAGLTGAPVPGWPESYIDIRSATTVAIIESMIRDQCAAKGFDAVETDIDESYQSANGFGLTRADEEMFMTTLAEYMHGLGLGWWIKNPDDTGDTYAADMQPLADAVLTEQCNQYSSCQLLSSYFNHKAIFNAEYRLRPKKFCASDIRLGINGAQFDRNLTGVRKPCA